MNIRQESILDVMDRGLEYTSVSFKRFMNSFEKDKKFIFVEGEDDEIFYSPKLRSYCYDESKWKIIVCNGKKNVLEMKQELCLHNVYSTYYSNYFYLIDSDYDDNSDYISDNTYILPAYSIENFYLSDSCFKRILSQEFKCREEDNAEKYKQVISHFQSMKKQFLSCLTEFNSVVYSLRRSQGFNYKKLNLKNIKTEDLIKIDVCNLRCSIRYRLSTIEQINSFFKELNLDDSYTFISIPDEYLNNRELTFRGKNNIHFLVRYLNELKIIFANKYNIKQHCKLQFSESCIISQLIQYADTPECLNTFIKKIFHEH